jgi:hypothetical protein
VSAANPTVQLLLRQFDTACALMRYHLDDLTDAECLWRPAAAGLHVYQQADGSWRVDWPTHEGYDLGPSSIAWLTWHLCFWFSMVRDHSWGTGTLGREAIPWPGSAEAVRGEFTRHVAAWRAAVEPLRDEDLYSTQHTRWPFIDRPFGDVVAWVTVELTKSAAEIGYARFLNAVSA